MRNVAFLCVALANLAGFAVSARAQGIELGRAGVAPRPWIDSAEVLRSGTSTANELRSFSPLGRPAIAEKPRAALRPYSSLASLAVPGSGQVILGNDRFIGYLAIEAIGWWRYIKDTRERAAQERSFKDLARRVARLPFSKTFPDADWSYYEWMRDFQESGQFSLAATGPVVPDTNPKTFNGARWQIALGSQTTYEAALAQYESEAIRPEYAWSWSSAGFQYDIYKRTTDKRNDAARAAVKDLLVIGANHFISMIDAFATFRLQVEAQNNGRTAVGATIRW